MANLYRRLLISICEHLSEIEVQELFGGDGQRGILYLIDGDWFCFDGQHFCAADRRKIEFGAVDLEKISKVKLAKLSDPLEWERPNA